MGGFMFHGIPTSSPQSPTKILTTPQALDPSIPLSPTPTPALHGILISKLETHSSHSIPTLRGYIAMLAVSSSYRGRGIATKLVKLAIDAMAARGADEIVLETEEGNVAAMRLYERLGFVRSKKLSRYYLNGSCAYRLVLHLKRTEMMSGMIQGGDRQGDVN